MAKFAPLLVAAALLGGLVIVASPAEATPCYQQGQPAPPGTPNTALLQAYCQRALDAWLTTLFVGRTGYSYGVITFSDRVVYDTLGGSTTQGYAACVQTQAPGQQANVLHACATNTQSLYRCNETGATVTCSATWMLKVAGDVDKLVANTPFVCMVTATSFAPDAPPGLPVSPPMSPLAACFLWYASPGGAPPPAPLTWPPTIRPTVDYLLP